MNSTHPSSEVELVQEPSIDTDKLSYEIFSILESKFLFGYDNHNHDHDHDNNTHTTPWKPKPENNNDVVVPSYKNQSRGKICVLSIDGGGMKNILSGKTLAYLETLFKQKSGDPNARIADFFDVAAGTGIGGVFTSMLFGTSDNSHPLYRADDTWRFLATHGNQLYGSHKKPCNGLKKLFSGCVSKHAATGFENSMKELFTVNGKCLTLKNTLKPVLIPCYDFSSSAPFLFSRADALETDSYDFNLWEVCRATSAFPGLFDPVEMKSTDGKTSCVGVDGGLAMSNPTAAAITHVLHNKQEFPHVRGVEDILLLSLGTGQVVEGSTCDYEKVKGWQGGQWCRPMARISGDASADMVDHAVAMAFGQTGNYVRIQANGSNMGRCGLNVDSDPSPSNVKRLTTMADEMLRQKNVESVLFGGKRISEQTNLEKLDWFAGELVLEHQRRRCRIAPTVSLKQAS
uniref:patatin-like protein 6 n=1 Tax=Erigeron canadensis TaxID=72917 RepID=UPI001CB8B72B|nr:patatin-like protein 6 [Erigeron canadensis]XP_043632416.1 patatin-like protein 6 [Erigeron canadensis]